MHARNEVVPLSTTERSGSTDQGPQAGPVAQALPVKQVQVQLATPPSPNNGNGAGLDKLEANAALNAELASAQERRAKFVQSQRRDTSFQLFYAIFGVALMIVQMEYLWHAHTRQLPIPCPTVVTGYTSSDSTCPQCLASLRAAGVTIPLSEGRMILHALRVLMSCSTALLLYYTYRFYSSEIEVMKIKNIVPPKATLLNSSLRKKLVLELIVLGIHPFPGLENVDPRWPNLVVAASLLMFLRTGLIIRFVKSRHSFNSSNGWFIGALTNVDFTVAFFLKSTLKNHPTRFILTFLMLLISIGGYSLFVVERFLCAFVAGSCCQPMTLGDALWSLIVTILTIGYGDVVPHTTAGRAFAVAAGIMGTITTAITIAVMSHYMVLTRSEHKVNAFLKKDENRRLLNDHAARSIQAFMHLRFIQRRFASANGNAGTAKSVAATHDSSASLGNALKGSKTGGEVMTSAQKKLVTAQEHAEVKLFDVVRRYRQAKRRINSQDVSDPMDKQMTMLEMMEVNVEYIRTKIEDLATNLQNAVMLDRGTPNNSNRSKRRITSVVSTPSTSATSQSSHQHGCSQHAPPTATIEEVDEASQVDDGSEGRHHHHHHHHRHPNQLSHSMDGPSSSFTSSSTPTRLSNVQLLQQSPVDSQLPGPSAIATNYAVSHQVGGPVPNTSLQQLNSSEGIPEWAILLESSLQAIMGQVAQVAAEVETIKSRVHQHMENVDAKLVDLERKLVVGDALREIARSRTARQLFRKDSSDGHTLLTRDSNDTHPAVEANGTLVAAATAISTLANTANGNANGGSGAAPRFRRMLSGSFGSMSSNSRRPSVQKFVTQKDLDEFNAGETLDG